MILRKKNRRIPLLSTTATADISFMLLTFFLMTTSMDSDKGILRQLPPPADENTEELTDVDQNKLMELYIDASGQLYADKEAVLMQHLSEKVAAFILQAGREHVVSVETHPESSYDSYFKLHNQLAEAYRLAREKTAMVRFSHSFAMCTQAEKDSVHAVCPQRVAENYSENSNLQPQ